MTTLSTTAIWEIILPEMFYTDNFTPPKRIIANDIEGNSWIGMLTAYRLDTDMNGKDIVRVSIKKDGWSIPFEAWLSTDKDILVSYI